MTEILKIIQPYSEYIGGVISLVAIFLPTIPKIKKKFSAGSIAGIVLTLGIFGTFIGVLIGLSSFNLADDAIGIQGLINSLKLAFMTSVSGMTSNLLIRFSLGPWSWPPEKSAEKEPVDLLITEVVRMTKAIAGDNESSLITQIVKLRTESSDTINSLKSELVSEQKELRSSFDQFARSMVENNQKALIEALNGIIQEFNTQLNEQLGGNFKYLNESIGKLNEWQRLYTEKASITARKMIEMVDRFEELSPIVQKTSESIQLWGLAQDEFGKTVNDVSGGIKNLVNTSRTLANEIPNVTNELSEITKGISEAVKSNDSNNREMIQEIAKKQQEVLTSFRDNIDRMIEEANNQIVDYREKTDKELEKSINSLGAGMISMSQAFVEKYGALKNIIEELDKSLSQTKNRR